MKLHMNWSRSICSQIGRAKSMKPKFRSNISKMDASPCTSENVLETGFDRHPLSSSYSMEMEMDVLHKHSEQYGIALKQKARKRRAKFLLPLFVFGAVLLVGATVNKVSRGRHQETSGRSTLSSPLASNTYGENPPPPPKHMDITCGAPNVKTLAGAQACEQICDAARCCTESCFLENRKVCLQYHESCQILDGVAATGETHQLPKRYEGGWFEKDHFLTSLRGQKVFPVDHSGHNNQLQREEACENYTMHQGLKKCIHLCMPAGCCYSEDNLGADFCKAPNGAQVDCRIYHDCNVLYYLMAP